MLARLANEPIDRIDPAEPIDPIDSTEPTEPIDNTEPTELIDSTDARDPIDNTDTPSAYTRQIRTPPGDTSPSDLNSS